MMMVVMVMVMMVMVMVMMMMMLLHLARSLITELKRELRCRVQHANTSDVQLHVLTAAAAAALLLRRPQADGATNCNIVTQCQSHVTSHTSHATHEPATTLSDVACSSSL